MTPQTTCANPLIRFCRWLAPLKFVPRRYTFMDMVARYYYQRGVRVQAPVGNFCVRLDLRDEIQRSICFGVYEPHVTRLLESLLKPGQIIIDVGANTGYISLLASSLVGASGRVYAFEPVPVSAQIIEGAIRDNAIDNIILTQSGLLDARGTMTLHMTPKDAFNSGLTTFVPELDGLSDTLEVPIDTLDSFVNQHNLTQIDLIKLDIEGAEPLAFEGMRGVLAQFSPDIICEVSPALLRRQGKESTAITEFLAEYGYQIYEIQAQGLKLLDPATILEPPHIDIYATRQ